MHVPADGFSTLLRGVLSTCSNLGAPQRCAMVRSSNWSPRLLNEGINTTALLHVSVVLWSRVFVSNGVTVADEHS